MKKYERYVRNGNNAGTTSRPRVLKKTNIAQKRSLILMLVALFVMRIDNIIESIDQKLAIWVSLDYPGEEILEYLWVRFPWDFIGLPLFIIAIVLWIRSLKKSGEIMDENGNVISED